MHVWEGVISFLLKTGKVAKIDFESLKRLFRRSLAWPRSWTERPPSKKKEEGVMGPSWPIGQTRCSTRAVQTPTQQSKQRFIRSKQQLQQFASPLFSLPPFCLILFPNVEIKPYTSTRAREQRERWEKKPEGGGGDDDGGSQGRGKRGERM